MRIAIVIPHIQRVHGNRCAFSLARALAESNEITVYAHTVYPPIVGDVRRQLGTAELRFLSQSNSSGYRMGTLFGLQLLRGRDRALNRVLRSDHNVRPFDVILVAGSEGHWLGGYVRKWTPNRTLSALWMYDLIDQVFLLRYRRPMRFVRYILFPIYPFLHEMERERLASFDLIFGLSDWTTQLMAFLYGLPLNSTMPAAVDGDLFRPVPSSRRVIPYVAVPTVSLDSKTARLVQSVKAAGVPLVSFGPHPVQGVPDRGFLSDAEMVQFLSDAQATLFLFDYEAFGLVPFESLACGTPVVTLPQEGPGVELRNNPDVRFGTTAAALTDHCRTFLASPKTPASAARCRSSVTQYFPAEVAELFVHAFQAKLSSRPQQP